LAWRTADRATADAVGARLADAALSMPPGLMGIGRGGPRRGATGLVHIEPLDVPRDLLAPTVTVEKAA
jgi:hypothetical protein